MSTATQYQEIDIKMLFPSPTNPRKHFNEIKLNELADSIRQSGVHEPIIVRIAPEIGQFVSGLEKDYPVYEIVAGERRYKASLIAERSKVPALVRQLTDAEVMEIQSVENLQREDVNLVDQAEAFKLWIDVWMNENKGSEKAVHEIAIQALADKIGKSRQWITKILKLTDLIDAGKQMVVDEKMTIQHAAHISRLTNKDQEACLNYIKREGGDITLDDLIEFIDSNILHDLTKVPFSTTDKDLIPAAGPCNLCPKRSGANQTLFNDIQNKDTCFDPACYHNKLIAFVDVKLKEFEAKGEKLLLVGSRYGHEDVVGKYQSKMVTDKWEEVNGKHCEYAEKAIRINKSEVGRMIVICREPKCKQHLGYGRFDGVSGGGRKLPTDPNKKLEVKIERGRELDLEKIYTQCRDAFGEDGEKFLKTIPKTKKMSKIEWALFIWIFDDIERSFAGSQFLETIAPKLHEKLWDRETDKLTPDKWVQTFVDLTDEEIALVFRCLFVGHMESRGVGSGSDSDKAIYLFAREHGVDVKAIEKAQAEIAKGREQRATALRDKEMKEKTAGKKKSPKTKNKATA